MKGICTNWDCSEFDENGKKVQDIPDGEDFVCKNPECGKKLQEVTDGGGFMQWFKYHKLPVIIVVAVVVIAGIMLLLSVLDDDKSIPDPKSIPIPQDSAKVTIIDTVELIDRDTIILTNKDTIIVFQKDTVVIRKIDTVVVAEEIIESKVKQPDPKPVPNMKTYSQGTYKGGMKNGVPDGQGIMIYTKHVRIAKHDNKEHYANAGYSLVGTWINGDISNGKLIDDNGNAIEVILAGSRNTVYNLENDN
jgi:hypothetical protein